jgi:hypothetical protein
MPRAAIRGPMNASSTNEITKGSYVTRLRSRKSFRNIVTAPPMPSPVMSDTILVIFSRKVKEGRGPKNWEIDRWSEKKPDKKSDEYNPIRSRFAESVTKYFEYQAIKK